MNILKRLRNSFKTNAKLNVLYKEHENEFLEKSLAELEESHLNKALWAKVLVESKGNESKARAKYIKRRCEQMLMNEVATQIAKAKTKAIIAEEKRESIKRIKFATAQLYRQAHQLHYGKGNLEQAKMIYKEIINNHPNSSEATSAQQQLDKLKLQEQYRNEKNTS